MGKVLGIDLGTTNSCMSIMDKGQPLVIPNAEGGRTTPSVVGVSSKGEWLVGRVAKNQIVSNPENTAYSVKRFIGRRYDEVDSEKKIIQYTITPGNTQEVRIVLGGKDYTPEELSAKILKKMKDDAEAYLGEKITEAVITVPAYFNDSQRKATKDAGEIAGLKVLRIINEPTAATLAYGLDKQEEQTVLVYDLGGGTFDVSILEIGEGVFEVKSTNGDTHLGGDDWDQRVVEWLVEEYKKQYGKDITKDKMAMQRLKEAAEKAKIELSGLTETSINLPYLTADESGPKHLEVSLSRSRFEAMTKDLIDRTMKPIQQAMTDAKVEPEDIDSILLVGGSTRMPQVYNYVKQYFAKEPRRDINPDECVAIGAGIQGGVLKGEVKDVLLLDVTPLSLGIETFGGVFTKLIDRNTTIPTKKSEVFSTATDNQSSVEIHVLQGERPMAADNHTLGKFTLSGIPPAPRGIPQIEVTFDIDANGILNVTAKDKGTRKEQSITIQASANLSKSEIENLKKEAEAHAQEDTKKKELVEARNQADTVIYTTEKAIKDFADKIDSSKKSELEGLIAELKNAISGNNSQEINEKTEKLSKSMYEISTKIYQQTQSAQGQPNEEPKTEGGTNTGDNVYDADFEVTDEDKKD
ncbi:MAG TPA: molecular chaperone DnaK [Methanofastidiosum sp.]|nr:molecular chaperone DnaK [Methanofastidiosum sp.]HNU62679.1 molecular chaperone DnaK [Methanofastidiosum sp.]HOI77680.1 molecular chaperone DnaK [Methanofastidiosum sp.]